MIHITITEVMWMELLAPEKQPILIVNLLCWISFLLSLLLVFNFPQRALVVWRHTDVHVNVCTVHAMGKYLSNRQMIFALLCAILICIIMSHSYLDEGSSFKTVLSSVKIVGADWKTDEIVPVGIHCPCLLDGFAWPLGPCRVLGPGLQHVCCQKVE